jgi:hypothetical protein
MNKAVKKTKPDTKKTEQLRTSVLKAKMLEALESEMGNVTKAFRKTGIARSTHYEWYDTDTDYRAKVNAIKDIALDFAEAMLFSKIKGGDTTSIIFFLKTQGKGRGYIEKMEHVGDNGGPFKIVIDSLI